MTMPTMTMPTLSWPLLVPALLLVCFLLYWAGSRYALARRATGVPREAGEPGAFDWHFFVPCRDEEAVVGTTVHRLRTDFPAAHVWVTDDASEDRTAEIVERLAHDDPRVHLVRRRLPHARTGKGAALNATYEALNRHLPEGADRSRVIVCVMDADGQLAGDAPEQVSGDGGFGDPEIGGVQITVRMRNVEDTRPVPGAGRVRNAFARLLVRMQDIEFAVCNAGMQLLRARTGSVGLGGNGQFTRLSALDAVAAAERHPWNGRALLEDYELSLHMTLNGHRVAHNPHTWVSQEGLPYPRRHLTQRSRWAQGNFQCMRYAPRIVSSRHYRGRGVLETLYTFLQPFAHLAMLVWCGLLFAGLASEAVHHGSAGHREHLLATWPFLLALAAVSVVPFLLWGLAYRREYASDRARATGLLWGMALWLYAYHLFPASARGITRILRGRNGWAKTRRNAEAESGADAESGTETESGAEAAARTAA